MEKSPAEVVTLDSDSEDELQIVSENITNYGNYSTPVEIAPELQEKIKMSLEKRACLPGKIKTIKVYATKRNNQEVRSVRASFRPSNGSTVRASFRPSNGQPTQTINVGPSINELFSSHVFSNQVRGGGNNNSRKWSHVTASDKSQKLVHYSPEPPKKRSQQPLLDNANGMETGRPSIPSSPVILYSPIKKRKTPQPRDPTRGFQQTFTHPPKNLDEATPPLIPQRENVVQENSKMYMKTSEEFKVNINFTKVAPNLSLNDLEVKTTCASLNLSVSPVKLSPVRFSNDELFVEDSILGIWNLPMPSPHGSVDSFLNFENKSPCGKVNDFDYIEDVIEITEDLVGEEETFNNMPVRNSQPDDIMSEVGEELHDKVYKVENGGNDEHSFPNVWPQNEENGPPLWTTIFPPSPPSPPPQSWMKSAALWDLDAGDFGAIAGLCGLETAKEIKRKVNAPKPLVRVLRKRHK